MPSVADYTNNYIISCIHLVSMVYTKIFQRFKILNVRFGIIVIFLVYHLYLEYGVFQLFSLQI